MFAMPNLISPVMFAMFPDWPTLKLYQIKKENYKVWGSYVYNEINTNRIENCDFKTINSRGSLVIEFNLILNHKRASMC